jgi:hypothetical protein
VYWASRQALDLGQILPDPLQIAAVKGPRSPVKGLRRRDLVGGPPKLGVAPDLGRRAQQDDDHVRLCQLPFHTAGGSLVDLLQRVVAARREAPKAVRARAVGGQPGVGRPPPIFQHVLELEPDHAGVVEIACAALLGGVAAATQVRRPVAGEAATHQKDARPGLKDSKARGPVEPGTPEVDVGDPVGPATRLQRGQLLGH